MQEIRFNSHSEEYGFLSNFYPVRFIADGLEYASVEHFYQSMKSLSTYERESIRMAPTALAAKRAGKMVYIRGDWDSVKDMVMTQALWLKFKTPKLRELLLATHGKRLIEDVRSDYYWGCGADGSGKNKLGEMLEEIREGILIRQSVPTS
jgi:hypothetical protein